MNGTGPSATSTTRGVTTNGTDADLNRWQDDSDLDQDESYYIPSTSFVQKLAALDPSLYHGSGDDFSTEENFDQTSAYINHQLSIHGFSSNLQFLKADKHSASRIVTALYKVLQQHLKDASYKEDMDLNWRRLSNDYDITIQNLNTTKGQLEKAERESDMLGGRISALEDELRVETEKHRYTREELKSAKANLQYAKTQYAHEARKKEQEMNVLKDKVQKSINRSQASSASIPGGIKILNPVPRSLYGKQNANDAEQLLKEVIEQQQAKEAEIVEENEQLRRTLYTVHVELEGLIKKHSSSRNAPTPYGLPFELVKDKIETEIRDTLTLLSDQWDHRPSLEPVISPSEIVLRDQRIEDLQKEIEKMQLELEDSTLLVQGAQKMIDNLTSGNFLAGGLQDLKLNVEGSDMTLQEIDEAESKIRQQREDLAKERKRFTEACLDLGKQRDELEQAKLEFEESKRTFRLDKVMSFLSFSPPPEKRTMDYKPPSSPARKNGHPSRKRVASSPLPVDLMEGRSVRPKTKTTVIEVPDEEKEWYEPGQEKRTADLSDHEYEEVDEEEELFRSPTRHRTNFMPSTSLEELSRSNHEVTRARLGAGMTLLPSPRGLTSVPSSAPSSAEASTVRTPSIGLFKEPHSVGASASQDRANNSTASGLVLTRGLNSSRTVRPTPTDTRSPPASALLSASASAVRSRPLTSIISKSAASTPVSSSSSGATTAAGQRTTSALSSNSRTGINSAKAVGTDSIARKTGFGEDTHKGSVPLLSAARVPSALSKAAAHLAARKSTARYPSTTSAADLVRAAGSGVGTSTTFSLSSRPALLSDSGMVRSSTPPATTTATSKGGSPRTGSSNSGRIQIPPALPPSSSFSSSAAVSASSASLFTRR